MPTRPCMIISWAAGTTLGVIFPTLSRGRCQGDVGLSLGDTSHRVLTCFLRSNTCWRIPCRRRS